MRLIALIIALLTFPAAAGPVHLFIVGDAGERVETVRPGATIGIGAWIFAPIDQVNGVDWKLSAPGFALASTVRTDWSPFADPIVNSPTLTSDLGAVVNSDAAGEGLWPLMHLTLIAPTDPGIYTLMPTAEPGTGWVDREFSDNEFGTYGAMTIVVAAAPNVTASAIIFDTPEPSAVAGVLLIGTWLILARRRAA